MEKVFFFMQKIYLVGAESGNIVVGRAFEKSVKFAYLYPSFIHLSLLTMLTDLLQTSYFAIFLIVALGFMLGRIKVMGLSLDVSAVIFIALAFGHWGYPFQRNWEPSGWCCLSLRLVFRPVRVSSIRSGARENLDSDYAADSGFCLPDRGRNEISF